MSGITQKRSRKQEDESTGDSEQKDKSLTPVQPDTNDNADEENEDDSDSDEDIVNVDFDYFDIKEIDFHATKNLLRQLLDADNIEFDLSAIADLIITQNSLGSTIKTDGIDSDPFALLTVLNINKNKDKAVIKSLADYFIQKTSTNAEFNRKLRQLFSPSATSSVGLIIQERLINMPTEVVPPMYKMLADEIVNASQQVCYIYPSPIGSAGWALPRPVARCARSLRSTLTLNRMNSTTSLSSLNLSPKKNLN